jgi:MFS family permease
VASLGTPLLPAVEQAEHVSLAASQWALTITLLAGSVITPVMGRLGDGRWRRRTIVGGVAVMLADCVLSAVPAGYPVFLAGRALQGAGLGLVPLATAVARDGLPAGRSRQAIAAIGITTAAGIGLGYPLVGLLAEYLGLYAPFWFVAGLSALALVASVAVLPGSPPRPARLDLPGALALGLGIAGLLLALAHGPVWGWASAATLASVVASALLLAAWAGWELRARHPLIDLRLTQWLPEAIQLRGGYILTGRDVALDRDGSPSRWPLDRAPLPLETSVPGVFAAGDVRYRSLRRVASAIGDGAADGAPHPRVRD